MREYITAEDVEAAHRAGKTEILIGPEDVVTAMAAEAAEHYGIRIGTGNIPAAPAEDKGFVPGFAQKGAPAAGRRPEPPFDLESWRRHFPILEHFVHVANCSQAPQSTFARDAALAYLESWNRMGMDWEAWMAEVQVAKAEFARLIHAAPEEIAMGTSVSELTSAVASSLPLGTARRKVVVTDAEFPTVGLIWQAHRKYGLEVDFVPVSDGVIDPEAYDRVVDEKTLLTSACHTYYYNGFRQDLAEIIPRIHAKGSLVFVDAYQSLGTAPLDVKALDVDFLASGNLKYLLGVPGIAFLYLKPEIVEHLHPAMTGWFGQENPFAFDMHRFQYARDARRFDSGTPPVPTAYIARSGMEIINRVGIENIFQWTNTLSEYCLQGAEARGLEVASPTDIRYKAPNTAIRVPGDSHEFELALRDMCVIASARNDVVRIAPHFFITLDEIDYVLDCYVKILQGGIPPREGCAGKKCWNLA